MIYKVNMKNAGEYSYCASPVIVWSHKSTIGNFCSLGCNVSVGVGDHPITFLSTSPYFYSDEMGFKNADTPVYYNFKNSKPIHIGNDVWIGNNVTIKNGITIGDGAIIGASAVVTKDVPPYAIVGGIPAKIIRYRFDEDIINQLLELKWWELDLEIIKQIPYDNILNAIDFLKKVRAQQ